MNVLRCIGALLLPLLVFCAADASAQNRTGTAVIGAGGGSSGSGMTRLDATIGQGIIGDAIIRGNFLRQGFWYGAVTPATAWANHPQEPSTGERILKGSIWPNPSSGAARLLIDLPATGHASVVLHDMQGTAVRTLLDGVRQAGRVEIPLDGTTLPSGSYTLVLTSGGDRSTLLFHLVR